MSLPEKYNAKKQDNSTLIPLEKGKLPPQAIELEEVVLGACLIDKFAISEVVEILSDNHNVFYKEAHQYIYKAMYDMFAQSEEIDLLTVSEWLSNKGKLELIGGDFYLIGLTQKVSSSAHIEIHCRYIMQYYVKRHSIKVASQIIELAYDETSDVFEFLEQSQKQLDDTSQWLIRKKPTDLKAAYSKFVESKKQEQQTGIKSKFTKLRTKMSYHAGDLVIVAGRPGMGKTALVLNEAKYMAKNKIPVGFMSLEMMTIQLVGRLVAEEFSIDANRIKEGGIHLTPSEKEVIEKEGNRISQLPIYIHDEGNLSVMEAKTIIGKWVRQHGVKIVFIDYLQLMRGLKNHSGNREQEISYISRTLKAIAKEFEIPIVALSQLSRAVETRGGSKRPLLSDLRESGAIEQDADVVIFPYRPEYYKIDEWEDGSPTAGQCEIDIAKIREGETGPTLISCNLRYMRFEDIEKNDDWLPEPLPKPASVQEAFEPSETHINKENDDDLPF